VGGGQRRSRQQLDHGCEGGADKRGRVDRGRADAGERTGAADVRGRAVRQVQARGRWAVRESESAEEREGGGNLGRTPAQPGEEKFPFLFFFSYFQIYFTFFFSIISFFL
jgi:hypothetical protein